MIREGKPYGNGEGMHIASPEGPTSGYVLYLLSLEIKEEEDSMDD
jgi:hypothetical protein